MRKVMITAALTGIIYTKEENPNLPEQPDEIIKHAKECREAGAAIVYIHARDKQGTPTMDVSIMKHLYDCIRAETDLIVEPSLSGAFDLIQDDQIMSLELSPELAPLNLGPTVLYWKDKEQLFTNLRSEIHTFAEQMLTMNIKPELEAVNVAYLQEINILIERELILKPYYVNLAFGLPEQGALEATPRNLQYMIDQLPEGCIFNVTSHGLSQLPMTTMSIILGGHVRVGMEDNFFYLEDVLAKSNAQLVARAARIIREFGYEVATPDDSREILCIN